MTDGALPLRPAAVADLPMILRAERAYMRDIEPDQEAGWLNAIDRNLEAWIANLARTAVVHDADTPVGYAMWTPAGDDALLMTVHVSPSRRRRRIGAHLMDWYAEDAARAGHRVLTLGVHRDNPARALYESRGYERTHSDGDYLMYRRTV
ncbi:GNAT family N-acetyltransferase [Streptomyces sp. NPDC050560]|uniref:GNAT family N-acetyltransferase n=1 Tax=Streptomyces sp. NPDC050560 TaxID=3365630 RepID=UPI0037A60289